MFKKLFIISLLCIIPKSFSVHDIENSCEAALKDEQYLQKATQFLKRKIAYQSQYDYYPRNDPAREQSHLNKMNESRSNAEREYLNALQRLSLTDQQISDCKEYVNSTYESSFFTENKIREALQDDLKNICESAFQDESYLQKANEFLKRKITYQKQFNYHPKNDPNREQLSLSEMNESRNIAESEYLNALKNLNLTDQQISDCKKYIKSTHEATFFAQNGTEQADQYASAKADLASTEKPIPTEPKSSNIEFKEPQRTEFVQLGTQEAKEFENDEQFVQKTEQPHVSQKDSNIQSFRENSRRKDGLNTSLKSPRENSGQNEELFYSDQKEYIKFRNAKRKPNAEQSVLEQEPKELEDLAKYSRLKKELQDEKDKLTQEIDSREHHLRNYSDSETRIIQEKKDELKLLEDKLQNLDEAIRQERIVQTT